MKTLATMTAAAALIVGITAASAQAPATTVNPGSPNATATDTKQTGSQTQSGMQTSNPKGSATVQGSTVNSDTSPAAPNAAASGEAQTGKSGSQPKSTQMQSGGAMKTPQTTGVSDAAAQSPAAPNAKPDTSVK